MRIGDRIKLWTNHPYVAIPLSVMLALNFINAFQPFLHSKLSTGIWIISVVWVVLFGLTHEVFVLRIKTSPPKK